MLDFCLKQKRFLDKMNFALGEKNHKIYIFRKNLKKELKNFVLWPKTHMVQSFHFWQISFKLAEKSPNYFIAYFSRLRTFVQERQEK